jgi:hypothetical protein
MAIVKKGFTNVNDIEEQQVKTIIKGATLADKKKNNAGRKKKAHGEKAVETMVVYFTAEQKEVVQGYCDKINIPFSTLVKQMLSEKGLI